MLSHSFNTVRCDGGSEATMVAVAFWELQTNHGALGFE